jgi:hypothetical protein
MHNYDQITTEFLNQDSRYREAIDILDSVNGVVAQEVVQTLGRLKSLCRGNAVHAYALLKVLGIKTRPVDEHPILGEDAHFDHEKRIAERIVFLCEHVFPTGVILPCDFRRDATLERLGKRLAGVKDLAAGWPWCYFVFGEGDSRAEQRMKYLSKGNERTLRVERWKAEVPEDVREAVRAAAEAVGEKKAAVEMLTAELKAAREVRGKKRKLDGLRTVTPAAMPTETGSRRPERKKTRGESRAAYQLASYIKD